MNARDRGEPSRDARDPHHGAGDRTRHVARSRPPRRDDAAPPHAVTDPDILAPHLEDAAHFPGGRADALFAPASEAAVAAVLAAQREVLAIGAQSSLTGGATPNGGVLLSTARFSRIVAIGADTVRVQAGVTLTELDTALAAAGRYYPPAPTFMGAFVGGTIATNAAGAATFKYGATRQWVQAITVVLASGDVLDVTRGETCAHADGYFDLQLSRGVVHVPIGAYTMPRVAKLSAGYFAQPGMDLIDLFIGAEGTLGVITEATLRVVSERPAMCLLFVTFDSLARGLDCVAALRRLPFVSAVEHMDQRCLQLLREDGIDRQHNVDLPRGAVLALLATIELPASYDAARAYDDIAAQDDATPLGRLANILASYDALDAAQIAAPGDTARASRLLAVREAVPAGVNQRVGRLKQSAGERAEKVAADVIVPFEQIDALLMYCRDVSATRGLDVAVWGHISDGNLHPNVIPRSLQEIETGKQTVLDIGREAIRLGGAPLAEHGVGRNRIKQQLLRELYGDPGIESMRQIKRALDPEWKLAPGVLFPG